MASQDRLNKRKAPADSTDSSDESDEDTITVPVANLLCCACGEHPSREVLFCRNGHLLCSGCYAKLEDIDYTACPTCDQLLPSLAAAPRNLAIQQILQIERKCRNNARGCPEAVRLCDQSMHSATCKFEPVPCIAQSSGCPWKGLRRQREEHHSTCKIVAGTSNLTRKFEREIADKDEIIAQLRRANAYLSDQVTRLNDQRDSFNQLSASYRKLQQNLSLSNSKLSELDRELSLREARIRLLEADLANRSPVQKEPIQQKKPEVVSNMETSQKSASSTLQTQRTAQTKLYLSSLVSSSSSSSASASAFVSRSGTTLLSPSSTAQPKATAKRNPFVPLSKVLLPPPSAASSSSSSGLQQRPRLSSSPSSTTTQLPITIPRTPAPASAAPAVLQLRQGSRLSSSPPYVNTTPQVPLTRTNTPAPSSAKAVHQPPSYTATSLSSVLQHRPVPTPSRLSSSSSSSSSLPSGNTSTPLAINRTSTPAPASASAVPQLTQQRPRLFSSSSFPQLSLNRTNTSAPSASSPLPSSSVVKTTFPLARPPQLSSTSPPSTPRAISSPRLSPLVKLTKEEHSKACSEKAIPPRMDLYKDGTGRLFYKDPKSGNFTALT